MKRSINNKTPNKGGRPTKKLSEKRKYRITVKMATEEYYAMKLKAKNAGVSASEIVRMAIRDCHIRARLTTEEADYIRKLCGIANNLNQLTWRVNEGTLSAVNLEETKRELAKIFELLNEKMKGA